MSNQPQRTRAEINRENAQHSTGPRTAEGKQRVAQNAVKHGLSGQTLCLSPDEAGRYQELLAQYQAIYQPQTAVENDLVHKICDAEWRSSLASARYMNLASISTFEHMEEFEHLSGNPSVQLAYAQNAGFRANARLFEQLTRHEGRFNRIAEKCTRELEAALAERQDQERATAEAQKAAAAKQTQPPKSEPAKSTKQSQPVPDPANHPLADYFLRNKPKSPEQIAQDEANAAFLRDTCQTPLPKRP